VVTILNDHNNFLFKILVVDIDPYTLQILKQKLLFPNYQILVVSNGPEAIVSFKNEQPDLIILDLMLPTLDGYKVCTELRKKSKIPILILTSLNELSDHILGFKIGVNDYILKPFIPKKLETRVHSLLYRSHKISKTSFRHSSSFFSFGNFKLNIINRSIIKNGTQIQLTKIEYNLLLFLIQNVEQIVTREIVFDAVWGYVPQRYNNLRLIDVYIFRLRVKLEEYLNPPYFIRTVRGIGYILQKE